MYFPCMLSFCSLKTAYHIQKPLLLKYQVRFKERKLCYVYNVLRRGPGLHQGPTKTGLKDNHYVGIRRSYSCHVYLEVFLFQMDMHSS